MDPGDDIFIGVAGAMALQRRDRGHYGLHDRGKARNPDRVLRRGQWIALIRLRAARRHQSEAKREIGRLELSLKQAKEGRVSLEPASLELMEALRREGMRPRAVCEVVDVAQDDWRDAAEIPIRQEGLRPRRDPG